MHYSELPPIAALSDYIRCIWILEGTPPTDKADAIFPDGSMELVFHYGTPMTRILSENESYRQPQTILVGQISRTISLKPTGPLGIIGIRFHPWGAFAFLSIPLHEITDKDLALELVWGKEIQELEDRIYHQCKAEAILAIQQFLLRKLSAGIHQVVPMQQVISHIIKHEGNVRIDMLADQCNLSERQFNRRFTNMVGLSPKNFAGIIRLQHFFKQALLSPGRNLGSVAIECGYYDQSHFIREFKQYAGISPGEYFKQDTGLAAFFL